MAQISKKGRMARQAGVSPMVVAVVAFVVLALAGAAFLGGRMAASEAPATLPAPAGSGGAAAAGGGAGSNAGQQESQQAFERSELLPPGPPELRGALLDQSDNTLRVVEGDVTYMGRADGGYDVVPSGGGQEVEVVVTSETKIYLDRTAAAYSSQRPGERLAQALEPITVEEISGNGGLSVWGERRGDRIIADVMTISIPEFTGNQ